MLTAEEARALNKAGEALRRDKFREQVERFVREAAKSRNDCVVPLQVKDGEVCGAVDVPWVREVIIPELRVLGFWAIVDSQPKSDSLKISWRELPNAK